jgi:hypothetical protein
VSANTPSIKHRRFNTPYLLPNTPASTRDHDQKPLIVPAPVASIVGSYQIFVNPFAIQTEVSMRMLDA